MPPAIIEQGSTILVTGANGFIASHVTDQLLLAGYNVRGSARSLHKVQWAQDYFDQKYGQGRFSSIAVPDMTATGAFDQAVIGVSGICHIASATSSSSEFENVVPPTIKGALAILESARKEKRIKSVVYTSSSTASVLPIPNKKIVITADTWNDSAIIDAQKPGADGYTVYAASKTAAEKALWESVSTSSPSFQFSTVLPATVFGSILQPGSAPSSSNALLVQLMNGDSSVRWLAPQWTVNAADIGRTHVVALLDPRADQKRLFPWAETFNWNSVLRILRKQNPVGEFLPDFEDLGEDLSEPPNGEVEALVREWYGKSWTGLEQSVSEVSQGAV